ncbi:Syntaxin-like protein [Mycena chlorophos]|uniref:Syntaxin-like protein n=1 Tax=Mycena chlorophos TaxID=658473 RepID=A0A8H6S194_MYCCL|nr:Syntaxin-like protein [Mycena chlorophos]
MSGQDRMAAYRARQGAGAAAQSAVPTPSAAPSQPQPVELSTFSGSLDTMPAFLDEASAIQTAITSFSTRVASINTLNTRALDSLGDASSASASADLEAATAEMRSTSTALNTRIKRLQDAVIPPNKGAGLSRQQMEMRQNRATVVRSKFVEALQEYQRVEHDARTRARARVERQVRIVKADATQADIDRAIDSGDGGQVFMQALTSSTDYAHARSAYNEVQARAQDLRKMEETLAELAQLFTDMALLVEQQNETLVAIEDAAQQTEVHAEEGAKQVTKTVEIARSLRRKRWICFFICLIVVIILAAVLAVEFTKKKN